MFGIKKLLQGFKMVPLKPFIFALLMAGLIVLSGCATTPTYTPESFASSVSPELEQGRKRINNVMLLPPQIDVEQISAGGTSEKIDSWCTEAQKAVSDAVVKILGERAIAVRKLDLDGGDRSVKANLDETIALYAAIRANVIFHNLGPTWARFPEPLQMARYTLGHEVKDLTGQSDALLLVTGHGHVASGGRRLVQISQILLALAVAGAARIYMTPSIAAGSGNLLTMALIDPDSGRILWYGSSSTGEFNSDLRDCSDAERAVRSAMKTFPVR